MARGCDFFLNPAALRSAPDGLPEAVHSLADGAREAAAVIGAWPGYAATPLLSLDALAGELGLAALFYKDEAGRFGLGSFKALGGAYAVYRVLRAAIAEERGPAHAVDVPDLIAGTHSSIASKITVTCATAGNHGRSVAWGARLFGCRAVIFVHRGVGQDRAEAIAAFGAEIVRVDGDYDAAVGEAARRAEAEGWTVVSDTSYPGYTQIPLHVMHGYTLLMREVEATLPAARMPTHLFVQGGVGGLAAGLAGDLAARLGARRPVVVVVEPAGADCLFASARAGERRSTDGPVASMLLGMACGEPSMIAWDILQVAADGFVTIPDDAAIDAMRTLNNLIVGGHSIVAGECAGAGLAALRWAVTQPAVKQALGLDAASRVLLIGTEGATDPAVYRRIMGRAIKRARG